MNQTAIQRAVEIAGNQSALARALEVTPQAVQQWVDEDRVPARRCRPIEEITGVSVHELRPDIFGPPAEQAA